MKNGLIRKGLVFSVIVLLIGVSALSSVSSKSRFTNDDTTPPVTTVSLNGTMSELGIFTSDVEVTLNATDDMSGVNVTYYRISTGELETYSEPFMVIGHGWHVLVYRSIDNAGNVEDWKSVHIRIDLIPPEIILLWYKLDNKSIRFEPYLYDQGSGIYKVEYYIDNNYMYTTYGGNYKWIWTPNVTGRHLITAIVYDEAMHSARDDKYIEITTSNTLVKEFTQIQNEMKPRTIYYPFLQPFPLLNLLLQRLRI